MAEINEQYRATTNAAFRFIVDIGGEAQAAFTECSLPSIEWEVEEVKEGGLNTYTHQLPGRRKAGKVSLKNGVGKSSLLDWYIQAMSEKFTRKPVAIKLLDGAYQTIMTWNLEEAYPVKWSGPQLKSDANAVAIQTLDLACGEITIKTA
jgi:phage tail-like protein